MYRRFLLFVFFAFTSINIFAQEDIIVIGQIFGSDDGLPVENAKVSFLNTNISTISNDEGYFYLSSPTKQKYILVEMLGYKTKRIKLDKNKRDQMVEVVLDRDIDILDEIVVYPNKNLMKDILEGFNKNRDINTPERLYGFYTINQNTKKIYLTNIQKKLLEKRIFSELRHGALSINDSSVILPVFFSQRDQKISNKKDTILIEILNDSTNSLNLFNKEQIEQMIEVYTPKADFYKNNFYLLGKLVPAPTSKNGLLYYNYSIRDSIFSDNSKIYDIGFVPKNKKNIALEGRMLIDSKTFALLDINAKIPNSANINFVKDISFNQKFQKVDSAKYYYSLKEQLVNFYYNFAFTNKQNYLSAILKQRSHFSKITPIDDKVGTRTTLSSNLISDENKPFVTAIDSLNQTKIQRVVFTMADLIMNGYIHWGKVDFGSIYRFIRFNSLEGFRPTLAMRTGEKLNKNVSLSGYLGYGFRDKEMKYGGGIQTCWGREKEHYLGAFYNNDVYRLGYDNKILLNENMGFRGENLLTSFSWGQVYDKLFRKQSLSLNYIYEKGGLMCSILPYISRIYSNKIVNFVQNSQQFSYLDLASFQLLLRFSFGELINRGFFSQHYLATNSPIISLLQEFGKFTIPNYADDIYAKIIVSWKHSFPTTLGKISYSIYGVTTFGKLPYILLEQPLTMQGLWYNNHNFNLINQNEFLYDLYGSVFFRYYSNGLLFNHIPYIKNLNLRETIFCNMAMGSLSDKHKQIFEFEAQESNKIPYIEAGIGVTNILKVLSVESIWRLTQRNTPKAINWGIRVKFYLDF